MLSRSVRRRARTRLWRPGVVALMLTVIGAVSATVVHAPATGSVVGVDVSSWQHPNGAPIDWGQVAGAGNAFAFVKATESTNYRNPWFASDWAGIRGAGMIRGAYHFADPAASAIDQAHWFVSVAGATREAGDLPPVLDLESTGHLTPDQLVAWAHTFLATVTALTGRLPILYTYRNFWQNDLESSPTFSRYPLWIADYGTDGSDLPSWRLWQYTSTAAVPGIAGNVDVSRYCCDSGSLGALADGTAPPVQPPPRSGSIVTLPDGQSGYALDGWGGIHPFGGAPDLVGTPYWPGWDIARGIALRADHTSGYVLDGWGGLHPFGGAPPIATGGYWPGWDIARGIVLRPDGVSGYTLDGWGGIHAFGGAPPALTNGYWPGRDIARGIALRADGVSGYTLDGWGAIHPFGRTVPVFTNGYWPGWDIARGIVLRSDGVSGYTLDGWGGLHPFGGAPPAGVEHYWPGFDVARGLALSSDGRTGAVVDAYGGVGSFSAG